MLLSNYLFNLINYPVDLGKSLPQRHECSMIRRRAKSSSDNCWHCVLDNEKALMLAMPTCYWPRLVERGYHKF